MNYLAANELRFSFPWFYFLRKFELTEWILILGASIDKPDRSPVAEESETNFDVDMCPNPDENKGPKLKKMLSLESGKEGIKQMKKVYILLNMTIFGQKVLIKRLVHL